MRTSSAVGPNDRRAPGRRLSAATVRRTMRLSVVDAMVYALMVGVGEAYFLADAIRLGDQTAVDREIARIETALARMLDGIGRL